MAGLGPKDTCEPNFEILYRSTTKKTRREYHRILSERTKKIEIISETLRALSRDVEDVEVDPKRAELLAVGFGSFCL